MEQVIEGLTTPTFAPKIQLQHQETRQASRHSIAPVEIIFFTLPETHLARRSRRSGGMPFESPVLARYGGRSCRRMPGGGHTECFDTPIQNVVLV